MGVSEALVRNAWAVIIVWVVVAGLAAPLAAKLNKVMVTSEESFLPPNVESIRAEKALGGSKAEPDAVIVVEGVKVGLPLYWRLRSGWERINWSGATHISFVDVLNTVYSKAYNASLSGVNSTVAGLRGYVVLWNSTLQAVDGLEKLELLLNATAKSMAGMDKAYRGYMNAARSLESAKPGLERLIDFVAPLCGGLPRPYAAVIFDVVRAEYLIENLTNAYERGYMTADDVERVVEASNLSEAGIPPLKPSLVVEVFNLTKQHGGPGAFTNRLAAWEAFVIFNSTLPPQVAPYAEALYNETAVALSSPGYPRLLDLAASIEGLKRMAAILANATEAAAPQALRDYGRLLARQTGKPIVGWTLEAFADLGCNESMARQALAIAMERQLTSNGMPPLPARVVAWGVAWGNLSREAVARVAAEVVALSAEKAGAPPLIVEAINSSDAVAILLKYDPQARGALLANATLARMAAAELIERHHDGLNVEPRLLEALAAGAKPEELALEIVESKAPPQARPLVEEFKARGIPGSLEGLLSMVEPLLVEEVAKHGVPEWEARLLVEESIKVFKGRETIEAAAASLASKAVEEAWSRVLNETEGSLISRDKRAFLVILFNTTYRGAKTIEGEVRDTVTRAAGRNVTVLATGGVVTDKEIRDAALRDVERSDRVSMLLVFIILAIVLESIVAVFLPFTGIGLGLAVALGTAYLLASRDVITVTNISRSVMFSTGLGLGIDYAAFISRRFREEMARLNDKKEAAAAALKLSARPVAAGATTAAIGFGSLALAWDFPFLKSIGTTVPLAIAFVAAASLTFIPALLSIVGSSRLLWWPLGPKARRSGRASSRLGGIVSRRSLAAVLVALVLVALAPAVYVHAGFKGTHDITLMLPEHTESLEGLRAINTLFDPGVLYPIYIVPSKPQLISDIAGNVSKLPCIARVTTANASNGVKYLLAIPSVNPLTSAGVECARQVRRVSHSVDPGSLVGGSPAVSLDLEELLNARFYHRVLPAAVGLMFLSMLVAYGGVVTALAAVGVVTIAAEYSIGATVYYYQALKGMGVPWFLPIVVFTAIMGVGMDYNSFSISRAAEECLKRCEPASVGRAVSRVAVLVLGLATIMAGAYGGLTLSSTPHLRMMGVSLLLGVLFAGVLASVALTPPLIALLGRAAWWPWGPRAELHGEVEGVE